MNKLIRMAVGALAITAVVAPLSTAAPASAAAAKHWTTIEVVLDAKQQACKVLINDATAWRIYNRLDARPVATGRVRATLTANHDGHAVESRSWQSGWVRHGQVSDVGTFKVPKQRGWTLTMTLAGDDAGGGGELRLGAIGRC